MKDTVFDQVIFSVAIVYSGSMFDEIKELDQHILVSMVATIIAMISTHLHKKWDGVTQLLLTKEKNKDSFIWREIVSQWFQILQMISTFIAIHNLVNLVNDLILNTERFYYEKFLFPVITVMFSIAAVTLFDHHFFSS